MQQHKVQKNADTENICIGVCIMTEGVGIKNPRKMLF